MLQRFLILGIPDGGLFLARQLRKQWPDSTIYAIGQKRDIGQYSNCIDCFYGIDNEKDFIKVLLLAHKKIGEGEIKAYCCSNPMLEWIVKYRDLFDMFTFENPFSFYQLIMDKKKAIAMCKQCGIRQPQEYSLSKDKLNVISYPVVAKPLKKMVDIPIRKCTYITTEKQMKNFLVRLGEIHADTSNVVCQQAINGDNRWEYGYGGYFQEGKPIIDICFHQFRQHPQGLCTYIREMTNRVLSNEIRELVAPLLRETKVNGFIEFDIKQDSDTKLLYLLDINPRPWRSSDMLTVKLGNSTIFDPNLKDCYVEWIYPWKAFLSKRNPRNVSRKQCKQVTGTDNYVRFVSISDSNDPNPTRQQKRIIIQSFVKSIWK